MHDEMIKYRVKVGSKRAKNIVNRVSVICMIKYRVKVESKRAKNIVNRVSVNCLANVLKSYALTLY